MRALPRENKHPPTHPRTHAPTHADHRVTQVRPVIASIIHTCNNKQQINQEQEREGCQPISGIPALVDQAMYRGAVGRPLVSKITRRDGVHAQRTRVACPQPSVDARRVEV